MCVLYLTKPGIIVRKDGGRARVEKENGECLYRIPLQEIESVVIAGEAQITTQLVFALLERNIQISYLNRDGHLAGTLGGNGGSLQRLLGQQHCFQTENCQPVLIRYVLSRKLRNQSYLLKLYAKRRGSFSLRELAEEIDCYEKTLAQHEDVDELRGIEGMASRCYFDGFPHILKNWEWHGRNRRPPKDPVNSLLSLGYTMLEREVRIGIAGIGYDARIGFLHSNDGRKDSLVFDLMEMFRQNIIDHFVFTLLNYGTFQPDDFLRRDGGCFLTDKARLRWYERYEEYMRKEQQEYAGLDARQFVYHEIAAFAGLVRQLPEYAA